jgi:hypothetical protein
MTKIIFYLTAFALLFITRMNAQNPSQAEKNEKHTFETRVKSISTKIENITKEEKSALKIEVEEVNVALDNGKITKEEADNKKLKLAETRAKNIEDRIAIEQENLKILVQQKVDGKIEEDYKPSSFAVVFSKSSGENKEKYQKRRDSIANAPKKRTTSQFVLAYGLNNVVTNKSIEKSDFYNLKSTFAEWGFTKNTRIFKNHNLLHLKYGFSVMYNSLRPTDNRYFVAAPNKQTALDLYPNELEKSRFKNVYAVAPLHVEFDFSDNKSANNKSGFSTHKGFRLGVGGYAGYRVKTKQKLVYNVADDAIQIKNKGDFNAENFIYGASTYLAYKETSLYLKYDLNPLFKNNPVQQNNISLGVRFDFN